MELRDYLIGISEEMWRDFVPHLSVDCVIFGFHENNLKVLVLRPEGVDTWCLPGGFVRKDENIDQAAHRVLKDRAGVENVFLRQFRTFGELNRSEDFFADFPGDLWHKQRFISIGYYALVNYSKVIPVKDYFSAECDWKDIDDLPEFIMDHREIVEKALVNLRKQLNYQPIGLNLLPEKFTMPELQKLYEIILGKKLNRGNFYRKMLRYDILEKLNESRKGGAHKAPDLYKFDEEKYKFALQNGLKSEW